MPLRETTFIERNVDTWRSLESELERPKPNPDVLRDLYASVSDDLSYARTHYPNRSVRSYLNHKAAQLSLSLYRNEKSGTGFLRFWTRTVPMELYLQRYPLLLAAAIFGLCFLVGWWSGVEDPEFLGRVVGMGYVEQTIDNIEAGDPMAVYKDGSRLGGALGIAGNNLYVSMLCFVSGILAGVGTLMVLVNNAIMVGAFQQFFFGQGVGWESVLGIWTHGTIEISSIVVAAGAGFVLAKGLLWPGTLSRSRSFQLTALSGLRIMAGLAPLIVLAAVIEGYLTRLTDLPTVLRVAFLLVNALFVGYYFVLRPYQVGRRSERDPTDYGKLPPDTPLDWPRHGVLATTRIFFDSVRSLLSAPGVLVAGAASGPPLALAFALSLTPGAEDKYYAAGGGFFPEVRALLWSMGSPALLVLALCVLVLMPWLAYRLHARLPGGVPTADARWPTLIGLAIPWLFLGVAAWLSGLVAWLLAPLVALWLRGISYAQGNVIEGLRNSMVYAARNAGRVLGLVAALTTFLFVAGMLVNGLWKQLVNPFIASNLPPALTAHVDVYMVLNVATDLAWVAVSLLVTVLAFGLLYHTLRELELAEGLRDRLTKAFAA